MRKRAARFLKRALQVAGAVVALGLLAVAAGAIWLRVELGRSLPQLDGDILIPSLTSPVSIERDAHGVPTLRGASRLDLAEATGFLHGQDRFFEMDLLRRRAAGEMAEILGPGLLSFDKSNRLHRFRPLAQRVLESMAPDERALVAAYSEGVNSGLAALRARPFEYLLLRSEPAPWKPEDSALVILSMFLDLQDDTGSLESTLGVMHDTLPGPLFEFLDAHGSEWDAPLVGGPIELAPVPGPEVVDLRTTRTSALPRQISPSSHNTESSALSTDENTADLHDPNSPGLDTRQCAGDDPGTVRAIGGHDWTASDLFEPPFVNGSNNWAVAGGQTASGGALLANDMHLGLRVPNIWYRVSLSYPEMDGSGRMQHITGVTLPGTPAMVVGSNGHIAWGFTNTGADWSDLVIIEPAPGDAGSYLAPGGPRKVERIRETIHVQGGPDATLDVDETIWGPIVGKDHNGKSRAIKWVAHDETATNFAMMRLEGAHDLDEALAIANRCGIPAQNFVAADAAGRIGWTIAGRIPRRAGTDGRLPSSWADGQRRWDGWLSPEEVPRVVDPSSGRIWTANARVVDRSGLLAVPDGGYDLGARARQIRDDLFALDKATARDMLGIQLDDRAVFLQRWRDLLLEILTPEAVRADPRRAELRRLVEDWGGHASIDSNGYRMVRAFRLFFAKIALSPLTAPCRKIDPDFDGIYLNQFEAPLWKLASERPPHLLDPKYRSWPEELLAGVDAALESIMKDGKALASHTWGNRNTASIQHPLSQGLPFIGRWLDMPREPLPGDSDMPRVQGPTFGASERLVVSPGREQEGFFHMPGGQSGHPLSPFYADGHAAWVRGEPEPFLPGPPVHTLNLRPAARR